MTTTLDPMQQIFAIVQAVIQMVQTNATKMTEMSTKYADLLVDDQATHAQLEAATQTIEAANQHQSDTEKQATELLDQLQALQAAATANPPTQSIANPSFPGPTSPASSGAQAIQAPPTQAIAPPGQTVTINGPTNTNDQPPTDPNVATTVDPNAPVTVVTTNTPIVTDPTGEKAVIV